MKSVYLKVTGKVQGVFFRASAQKQAIRLNLRGWVKNTNDFVEITVSGETTQVDEFIQWAYNGPERAEVANVETRETTDHGLEGFQIIR